MGQTKAVMGKPESWEIVLNKFDKEDLIANDVAIAYSGDLVLGCGSVGLVNLDVDSISDHSAV